MAHVDPATGTYTGQFTPIALSGYVRQKAESDMAVNALVDNMENKWPLPQNY